MAVKDRDLIKPSIYSYFANAIVGFIFAIPLFAAIFVFNVLGGEDNAIGQGIVGLLGAIMLFAQYTVSYIFSGMTVYLIYGYLSEGDGQMVIEDLNLWNALKRATHLIKNNLLLVGVGFVGVNVINNLIGGAVIVATVVIAVGIAVALSAVSSVGFIIGIVIGVALVILVSGVVTVVTSYIGTAYHTSLFIWARDAEKAVQLGQAAVSARAPAPLAAVLGG